MNVELVQLFVGAFINEISVANGGGSRLRGPAIHVTRSSHDQKEIEWFITDDFQFACKYPD